MAQRLISNTNIIKGNMILTKAHIINTLRLFLSLAIVCCGTGCGSQSPDHDSSPVDVLSFQRAKAVEPALLTTDELTRLIQSDTTHNKVVYYFDILCKPCLEHLKNEVAAMYSAHDTSQWRFYLVAGLNWLHRLVPDAEGNLVEDTLGNFAHFANKYRTLLPSLGYNLRDVYMHYNPAWEHTSTGVFTPWVKSLFKVPLDTTEGIPFHCRYEGTPQLFKADSHNILYITLCSNSSAFSDTVVHFYAPDDSYSI